MPLFTRLLLLTLSLIWISIITIGTANAQQTVRSLIGIKITTPSPGQNISFSTQNGITVSNLTVSGTSTDNNNTDCQVSVIVNGIKPYQSVTAIGGDGKDDYSKWNFILTPKYHAVLKEGPSNKITAKLACSQNLVKWYSLNVTGVNASSSSSLSSTDVDSPARLVRAPDNLTAINTNRINDSHAPDIAMINITSPAPHQEIPTGSKITIYGTSMANFQMDCKVYTKKNNQPFQNATPTGSKGAKDYSTWKSTYSDNKDLISSGDTNNLTAMLSCYNNQNTTSNHMTPVNSSRQLVAYANVNIIGINEAPIAVAKIDDKKVNEGEKVILNGAGSKDPNRDSLTYLWKQTGGFPNDLDIVGFNKARAKITIPDDLKKDTKFAFELTVTDSYGETSTDSVFVDAIGNTKPVADAGNDKKAVRGDEVTLDGTHSHDRDKTGRIVSYKWEQISGGVNVDLQNPDEPVTTFTVPLVQKDTTFEFALTVTDDEGAKDQDKVKVGVDAPLILSPMKTLKQELSEMEVHSFHYQ